MLNPLYEAHIRRVEVALVLSAPDLKPEEVTEVLGINPDAGAVRGEELRNVAGQVLLPQKEGWWRVSTKHRVRSKDINDHFHYLLRQLLPQRDRIERYAINGNAYFDVLWESTYLYAGTGPIVSQENIAGIAALNAGIGFDIYALNDDEA